MTQSADPLATLIFGVRDVSINGGATLPRRSQLNVIAGSDVTLTAADNPSTASTDLTVAASGGGSAPSGTGLATVVSGAFGTTLAPGTSGNVATSDGTAWTSAAPAAPAAAGATKDVQINISGAVGADTGNFTFDASLHALTAGSGCAAAAPGSCSFGIGASATQSGEFKHASYGPSNFQDRGECGVFGNSLTTTTNLAQGDSTEFQADSTAVACVEVAIVAVSASGSKRATEMRLLQIFDDGTNLTIDFADTITKAARNLAAQGWGMTISAPGGHTLRFAANPGSDTVNFGVRISRASMVW